MIVLLIAVLVPGVLLVGGLGYWFYKVVHRAELSHLRQGAVVFADRITGLDTRAGGLAAAIGALDLAPGEADCTDGLRRIVDQVESISGLVVIDRVSKATVCAALPDWPDVGATLSAALMPHELAAGRLAWIDFGAATGFAPVWIAPRAGHPQQDLVVILAPELVKRIFAAYVESLDAVAALVDQNGRSLVASENADSVLRHISFPARLTAELSTFEIRNGRDMVLYVVAPIAEQRAWLVVGQPKNRVLRAAAEQILMLVGALVALNIAAVLVLNLGLRRFVLRWLGSLNRTAAAYARGNVAVRAGTPGAPVEIAELANSFDQLADRVAERTSQLSEEVHEKRQHVRELHHRVKNNLQVISSLLALQKRQLPAEQRRILRFPEDRINAMSAAYRTSYSQSETGRVSIGRVCEEVVARLSASGSEGGGRTADVKLTMMGAEGHVDLDTAIALSMLLAEVLPRFVDGSVASGEPASLVLDVTQDAAAIDIEGVRADAVIEDRLSERFVAAFLRQLGATMEDDGGRTVHISVPLRSA